MDKHHEFGMSRWPALLDCACFESEGGGKYAETGTNKHELFAHFIECMKGGEAVEVPEDFHGRGALIAAQKVMEDVRECGGDPASLRVETRVEISGKILGGIYGTADAFYVDHTHETIHVWDFKTFYNPSRDYTPQLVGYAWAIQTAINAGVNGQYSVAISTLYGDAPNKNLSLLLAPPDVNKIITSMDKVINIAKSGEGEPTQCGWCELCKHKSTCPAFRAVAVAVTDQPELANAVQNWETLPVERKAQLMVLAETVCKWADGVRDAAKADLLAGTPIADEANGISYVLRTVTGRKTPRTLDAWKMLVAKGVDPEAIKAKLSISASAVKDILKGVGIKGKAADDLVAEVSEVGKGSTQMVRG